MLKYKNFLKLLGYRFLKILIKFLIYWGYDLMGDN